MNLQAMVAKAEKSAFYRWLLSYQLNHMVPFNAPHGFKITSVSKRQLRVMLPFKKRNLNHLRGIHACALATLAEVTSGFLMVINLNPKKYRIILHRLEMEYHFQAKSAVHAQFEIDKSWFEQAVIHPLKSAEKIMMPLEVKIYDASENHVATGTALWQIKDWQKVKTKLK